MFGSKTRLIMGVARMAAAARVTAVVLITAVLTTVAVAADSFSGASALEFTKRAVAFGPRPSGSEANRRLEAYIVAQLKTLRGAEVTEDAFVAKGPNGSVSMKNVIAKFPGKARGVETGRGEIMPAIVITGHFDTKLFPNRNFVGANDGGSSTGLLLELARVLATRPRTANDIYVVFFDGEEAFGEWTDTDSVYGSRHLAELWRGNGMLRRVKALINVDMIGDKSLDIKQETGSNPGLRRLVWTTASELGYRAYFIDGLLAVDDDHMPFLKMGVPAIDIIDFNYPAWHEDTDTLDKISAQSLDIVGTVVLEAVHRLEIQ